jgi:hypothetical protein
LPDALPASPAHTFKIAPCPQPTSALLASKSRLSISTTLSDILDDEAGRAVLEKHLGEILALPQIKLAAGFSLKQIAQFVPDLLTPEKLDQIAGDLASI